MEKSQLGTSRANTDECRSPSIVIRTAGLLAVKDVPNWSFVLHVPSISSLIKRLVATVIMFKINACAITVGCIGVEQAKSLVHHTVRAGNLKSRIRRLGANANSVGTGYK